MPVTHDPIGERLLGLYVRLLTAEGNAPAALQAARLALEWWFAHDSTPDPRERLLRIAKALRREIEEARGFAALRPDFEAAAKAGVSLPASDALYRRMRGYEARDPAWYAELLKQAWEERLREHAGIPVALEVLARVVEGAPDPEPEPSFAIADLLFAPERTRAWELLEVPVEETP